MPRDVAHEVHGNRAETVRAGRQAITCLICPENPAAIGTPTMITKDFPLI
jgi:hypothetical protein